MQTTVSEERKRISRRLTRLYSIAAPFLEYSSGKDGVREEAHICPERGGNYWLCVTSSCVVRPSIRIRSVVQARAYTSRNCADYGTGEST